MTAAKERTVRRENAHYVALGGLTDDLGYGARKNPGMETQDGVFPALF